MALLRPEAHTAHREALKGSLAHFVDPAHPLSSPLLESSGVQLFVLGLRELAELKTLDGASSAGWFRCSMVVRKWKAVSAPRTH